jgi:hypothetical protein
MEELINLSGQKFYYSNVEVLIQKCVQFDKCAVIIDEHNLVELLDKGMDLIGDKIDQIFIIGENLNNALIQLQDKEVLLISANNLRKAISYAMLNVEITKEIVCVPKENKTDVGKIIELIIA